MISVVFCMNIQSDTDNGEESSEDNINTSGGGGSLNTGMNKYNKILNKHLGKVIIQIIE